MSDLQFISVQEFSQWYHQAKFDADEGEISRLELDWFVLEVTGLDRLSLCLESFYNLPQISLKIPFENLQELWQKRLQDRIPFQYLMGVTYWRNFTLKVTPDVLIPRPETEEIIDYAVNAVQNSKIPDLDRGIWVDLGTGSGAIACGLAQVFPHIIIHAVDYSESALKIAQTNGKNLGFAERIKFDQGSWWQPLNHLKGQIKGMISNPPYIPTSELLNLQPEVIKYEPYLALDGGEDGLKDIRYLVNSASEYLVHGGIWLIEIMKGQGKQVTELLIENGNYDQIQICYDLDQVDRFVLAYAQTKKKMFCS
jgi:release factor glutamine methyltransferase